MNKETVFHTVDYCFAGIGRNIIVVAQTQAELFTIFGDIYDAVKRYNIVKRYVSSPFWELSFLNGSHIRGFSSQNREGEAGHLDIALCGQQCSLVLVKDYDKLTADEKLKLLCTYNNVEGAEMRSIK